MNSEGITSSLSDEIKSLFEKLNNDDAKLFRIEFLAVFIAFVLLVMSVLDSFRNRSRNPLLKYLLVLDAIAGSLVTYTVGVMQSTPLNNELIQVWAVLLTILYDSSSGFSAHSLQEEDVYIRPGWLVVLLISSYQPSDDTVFHEILGKNGDVGITILVLIVIIAKDTWETAIYFFSIWAKVALVGKYVRWHSCQESFLVHVCLGYLCKFSLMRHWHGKIHQYSLLRSYRYDPWCWKNFSKAWRLMTDNVKGGGEAIRVPLSDQVKEAVINSLRLVLFDGQQVELTNGLRSLQRNNMSYGLHWACKLETQTHNILVWHIATTLCEISLGQPNSLSPVGRCLLRTSCKPPAFDVDVEKLQGEFKSNYMVATSLSRYCACVSVHSELAAR